MLATACVFVAATTRSRVCRFFRHGIDTARMPGIAFRQAHGRKHSAFQCAMLIYRVDCVVGTRWVKATILPEPGTDAQLVCTNQNDQQSFHD
jgi:hypothetical protein